MAFLWSYPLPLAALSNRSVQFSYFHNTCQLQSVLLLTCRQLIALARGRSPSFSLAKRWSNVDAILLLGDFSNGSNKIQPIQFGTQVQKGLQFERLLNAGHDVRMYFTGPHSCGKIFHFAGSGHRRILELWGGILLS